MGSHVKCLKHFNGRTESGHGAFSCALVGGFFVVSGVDRGAGSCNAVLVSWGRRPVDSTLPELDFSQWEATAPYGS